MKSIKQTLILTLLFLISGLSAQETLRVTYQAIPQFEPEEQSSLMGQEMAIQAENIISGFEFELLQDKEKSLFRKTGEIFESSSDDLMYRVALGFSGGDEIWYTELGNSEKILYRIDLDGEVTLSLDEEVVWHIGTETKTIGKYTAIRATTSRKKARHIEEIEVWFTPELPYSFGPLGYNGLPGLILEMKRFEVTYKFKKIEQIGDAIDPRKETHRKMSFKEYYRIMDEEMQSTIKSASKD